MPLMDLTTPVELYAVEVLRDSNGRAQAYFTFLNCAAQPIASLYATLTLLDDAGASLGSLSLRCEGLSAPGHSRFTVCRAMDDGMFSHLVDATYALIGHENSATESLDAGLFSDKAVSDDPDLYSRIKKQADKAR